MPVKYLRVHLDTYRFIEENPECTFERIRGFLKMLPTEARSVVRRLVRDELVVSRNDKIKIKTGRPHYTLRAFYTAKPDKLQVIANNL